MMHPPAEVVLEAGYITQVGCTYLLETTAEVV